MSHRDRHGDHTRVDMRRLSLLVAFALLLVACGDALEGVGDLSRGIVHGEATSTTTTQAPTGPALRLVPVTDLIWVNDGVGAANAGLSADVVLRSVWNRAIRDDTSSPQSSRREIADVLPGIEFPQLAPEGVTHVSSQLVFDLRNATLGVGTAAAFGLWVGQPYTAPRTEAQLAVLQVGRRTFDDGTPAHEILEFEVTGGRELSWVDGDHVYQLFCRTGVSEAACVAMAESTIPLSLLAGLARPAA